MNSLSQHLPYAFSCLMFDGGSIELLMDFPFFFFLPSRSLMQVEAFPEPIRYWEKIPDNRLIEQSEFDAKYNIETVHSDM